MAIGSLIHNWIPQEAIELVLGDGNPSRRARHHRGRPIYADTFGAIPIAEALYLKGTGLGTVLAFMMSVTVLSIPSLAMLSKVIKPKLMATFCRSVHGGNDNKRLYLQFPTAPSVGKTAGKRGKETTWARCR